MEHLAPAVCAQLICFTMWGLMASGAAWLAHRRMVRVEAELGRRAVPAHEAPLLVYAGASVVWVSAAVLAAVGLFRREWARLGRNCFYVVLAHFTLVVLLTPIVTLMQAAGAPESLAVPSIVGVGSAVMLASVLASVGFLWRWGTERVARIESGEPTGDPPGNERWALYIASVMVGMVGFLAPFVYREPQNVRVGVTAMRISGVYLIAVVCSACAIVGALSLLIPS